MNGLIFDIQRFSIHDGPGIRTTVFMKGCPLRCAWCHNPESISDEPQIAVYRHKCIGCGECRSVCSTGALADGPEFIDRSKCRTCGKCAEICPNEAIKLIGLSMTAAEVVDTVMRDAIYYETSGGGVTLSGGEPLRQYEFSLALLGELKKHGLYTAVETCGACSWEKLEAIANLTDLFLYDLKMIDPAGHLRFCGADNSLILDNARRLAAHGSDIIFRVPVIPGCNDSPNDIIAIADFIISLPNTPLIELMPYHRIGRGKYEALGMRFDLTETCEPENVDSIKERLREMGMEVI